MKKQIINLLKEMVKLRYMYFKVLGYTEICIKSLLEDVFDDIYLYHENEELKYALDEYTVHTALVTMLEPEETEYSCNDKERMYDELIEIVAEL